MEFLAFCSLILKPNFDLRFVQIQFAAELKALFIVQISAVEGRGREEAVSGLEKEMCVCLSHSPQQSGSLQVASLRTIKSVAAGWSFTREICVRALYSFSESL